MLTVRTKALGRAVATVAAVATAWLLVAGAASPAFAAPGDALANYGFSTPGWATFGISLPQGKASTGLQVGDLPTQTDVKNRWPDGSIKYAIVTTHITTTGSYSVSESAPLSGTFTPVVPQANLTLTMDDANDQGQVYTSTLPSTVSSDLWLNGPLVREWRVRDIPARNGTPHPFLSNIWDVRVYNDGTGTVDATMENIRDVASATGVVYGVDLTVNGKVEYHHDATEQGQGLLSDDPGSAGQYTIPGSGLIGGNYIRLTSGSQAGQVGIVMAMYSADLFWANGFSPNTGLQNVTWEKVLYHQYGSRWHQVLNIGGFQASDVKTDFSTFIASGAAPAYLPTIGDQAHPVDTSPWGRFDILGFGNQAVYAYSPGLRAEIGPYPQWAARTMVHGTDALKQETLAYGDLASTFSVDFATNDPSRVVTLDDNPNYWPDVRASAKDKPLNNMAGAMNVTNTAHQASLAYIPYLVTGDRYCNDELMFTANWDINSIGNGGNWPRGADGMLWSSEHRGYAWAFRNITDAANYLPDGSAYKSYFERVMNANLRNLDAYAQALDSPLGFVDFGVLGTPATGDVVGTVWELTYLAWALDHAINQNGSNAAGSIMRDQLAGISLGLLTNGPDYPPEYADLYLFNIGAVADGKPSAGLTYHNIDFYRTWAELFKAADIWNTDGSLRPNPPWVGYYGTELRLAMLLAKKAGMAGSDAAYNFVMSQDDGNPGSFLNSLNNDVPQFALADVSLGPPDQPVTGISNVPSTTWVGQPLTLDGTVAPAKATNRTITWSVSPNDAGTTGATITGSTLTAPAPGTVTVRATIANGAVDAHGAGTDYVRDFAITVSPEAQAAQPQTLTFADTTMTRMYGDPSFANSLIRVGTGALSYTNTNPQVATVDATGRVTILNAGATTITVTAAAVPNEWLEASATYTLTVQSCSLAMAAVNPYGQTYSGGTLTPPLTVWLAWVDLIEGVDYTVAYSNNVNVGQGTVTVTGIGNYTGTASAQFPIAPRAGTLTIDAIPDQLATGEPVTPPLIVRDYPLVLALGQDYTVAYSDNVALGTATVTVTGIGNYLGSSGSATFQITSTAQPVQPQTLTFANATVTKTVGEAPFTNPLTRDGTGYLWFVSSNYAVASVDGGGGEVTPVSAGTTVISVTAAAVPGEWSAGAAQYTIVVKPADIASATVTVDGPVAYTGTALTPAVTVTVGGNTLVEGADYRVSYANNMNAGQGTVTVTGIGAYSGTTTKPFTITPRVTTLALSALSNQMQTGKAITPPVVVRDGATVLPASAYTLSYADNVAPGTATVTATGAGNYAGSTGSTTFKITTSVLPAQPQSLSFAASSVTKTVGDAPFTNVLTHDGGGTVTFSSSDPTVATVDTSTGEVTVVGAGSATITANAAAVPGVWEGATASYTLTVNPAGGSGAQSAAVTGIRSAQTTFYVVKGKSLTIPYAFDLQPGETKAPVFTWTSSNDKNVSVTQNGKVTGLAAGKSAKVTVQADNGLTKTFMVKVAKTALKVTKVSVTKPPKTLTVGKTAILKVKASPSKATGAVVKFTLDKASKKYVTVDKAGKVTALAKGTAKITVKDGGKKTVVTIKVK